MESAADVGDVAEGIEVSEDSVAVDENHIGPRGARCIETRESQNVRARPGLDRSEMRVAGLMRCDD